MTCGLAAPCVATRRLPTLGDLGKLTLAMLLLGVIGGFGEVIALYITTKIRCYNRLSIFVGFFSLFALALVVNRPGHDSTPRPARWGWLTVLWVVTALGLLDQIPAILTPNHAKDISAFRDDKTFVTRVEKSLPPGAMIFQLPPISFPEFGRQFQMDDYSHFRGYLHSHRLRWSYGPCVRRQTEAWQSRLARSRPRLVDALTAAGFAGIYVDRKGHEASATTHSSGLLHKLPQEPVTNGDGSLGVIRLPSRRDY